MDNSIKLIYRAVLINNANLKCTAIETLSCLYRVHVTPTKEPELNCMGRPITARFSKILLGDVDKHFKRAAKRLRSMRAKR